MQRVDSPHLTHLGEQQESQANPSGRASDSLVNSSGTAPDSEANPSGGASDFSEAIPIFEQSDSASPLQPRDIVRSIITSRIHVDESCVCYSCKTFTHESCPCSRPKDCTDEFRVCWGCRIYTHGTYPGRETNAPTHESCIYWSCNAFTPE